MNDDEALVAEPILAILDASGGAAGHRVFAVVDRDIGGRVVAELRGDRVGAAIGADRHLTNACLTEDRQNVFDDGPIHQGPKGPG